jgi:hypothetical protein
VKEKNSRGQAQPERRAENEVKIERTQKKLGPMKAIDTEESRKKKEIEESGRSLRV